MSDHCKSNEIVESAIEKRLMIMMRIKEIHKLNVVKKKKKSPVLHMGKRWVISQEG